MTGPRAGAPLVEDDLCRLVLEGGEGGVDVEGDGQPELGRDPRSDERREEAGDERGDALEHHVAEASRALEVDRQPSRRDRDARVVEPEGGGQAARTGGSERHRKVGGDARAGDAEARERSEHRQLAEDGDCLVAEPDRHDRAGGVGAGAAVLHVQPLDKAGEAGLVERERQGGRRGVRHRGGEALDRDAVAVEA
eukprot:CAMPEP_0185394428 /NCGR_PEP_ID=MMETSP1364-20130426/80672_1 /TAXON_ID=38817 /ORGANISM="Gephyrocapsa oceanica, Strain RCC1303" /LENGTH=194 /DNA_ID=CAMNT_0027996565 /DNA_START=65 /DNA_END=646 /DNA_ORIENTATION=+